MEEEHGNVEIPWRKRYCVQSLQQVGAGIARKLESNKGDYRETGIKGLCLNSKNLSVFTNVFCPVPFVLLHAVAI